MSDSKIIIVHLRQPKQYDKEEMRSDPFYELGSFGCTGCHKRNLMNPKKIEQLDGTRLAFAQGGPEGFKLIQLTPPVKSEKHKNCCELKWEPDGARFFKYENAPLLINNAGRSDFPFLEKMLKTMLRNGKRTTLSGQFSSCFRSRRKPLENPVALEMVDEYLNIKNNAKKEHFTRNYVETMHERPPIPDDNRKETYQNFIRKANLTKSCRCKCKRKSC